MVHALRETWRVLGPAGLMADIRPLSLDVRVEIETGPGRRETVGELDESDWREDDLACDRAVAQVVQEGWFRPVGQFSYDFRWVFDSLEEMVDYAAEKWEDRADDATLTRAAWRLAALPDTARLCVRKPVHFAIYRRMVQG